MSVTLSNRSPATSVAIGPSDPLSFDLTSTTSPQFKDILVTAKMAGTDLYEVVYDGVGFAPLYAALSTVQSIAGGYRFRVRRFGGWPAGPTLGIKAFDNSGNEVSG